MHFPKILFATAAFAAMAIPGFCHFDFATSGSCNSSGAATIQVRPAARVKMRFVTGVPYSARQSVESVQTLADGTHITARRIPPDTMTWRDSSGRVRTEVHPSAVERARCNSVLVQIEDPVAGHLYVIDPVDEVAYRLPLLSTPAPPGGDGAEVEERPAGPGDPTVTSQALGKRVMFGVEEDGTMRATTWPAGSRMGNDRPLTITDEVWTAPGIGPVYSKNSNPDGTVTTITLNDLSTAEPDPARFQIPAGYKIVDEPGPFTISISAHN